jgi:hypothetical protein
MLLDLPEEVEVIVDEKDPPWSQIRHSSNPSTERNSEAGPGEGARYLSVLKE